MSSPDWAIEGKSCSSLEVVNCKGDAVSIAWAFPPRKVFLIPNGTSVDAKLKFPGLVVTLNVTGPLAAEVVTITPVSWNGPGGVTAGVVRVEAFHDQPADADPEIASEALNRHPVIPTMVAPLAVMDPSQAVGAL